MKLDLYSPHPYLEEDRAFAGIHDMPTTTARYMAELHWLGASTEMPWMVGETSFSANDGNTDYNNDPFFICLDGAPEHHTIPFMHGTEADQATFVNVALNATHASRGSGFSWWFFQDGRSNPYQSATAAEIRSNYFGALSYGDGTLPWREKPMVDVVQAFPPAPVPAALPVPPPAYGNWHGSTGGVYRTYHLQDQHQEPVPNGVALVEWVYQATDPLFDDESFRARAVSNEQGVLILHKPDPVQGYITPLEASQIKVDAPGAIRQESSSIWSDEETLTFNRQLLPYAHTLTDIEINLEAGSRHAAWAELTVQDVEVIASGTENDEVIFEARRWVRVAGEFHMGNGSEGQLRIAMTFPDCSYPSWGMAPDSPGLNTPAKASTARSDADISLRFKAAESMFKASPNPFSDILLAQSSSTGHLEVRDPIGRLILSEAMQSDRMVLDTRLWTTGLYVLTLKHKAGTETLRILKAQ